MRIIFCICAFLFTAGCDDDDLERDTIHYFKKHLKPDMEFPDLRMIFGEPDDDLGSGIHIYVYYLQDGTTITIGYTDKILYARHFDEVKLLEELI